MKLKETKISGQVIYDGRILKLEVDEVRCPNGHISKREVIRHRGASCIMAEINGKFILEEQYRYPYDEVILEFPAGKVDPNETFIEAAKRELEEETGYIANKIIHLGDVYPSVAYTDEVISIFYASELKRGTRHLDENEAINLHYHSLEEFQTMIKEGKIKDAKTLAALAFYESKKRDF